MDLIERLNWLLAEYQAGRNPLSENATCSLLWEIKSEFEKLTRLRSEVEGARAKALEEAATCAENFYDNGPITAGCFTRLQDGIAKAIRELASDHSLTPSTTREP